MGSRELTGGAPSLERSDLEPNRKTSKAFAKHVAERPEAMLDMTEISLSNDLRPALFWIGEIDLIPSIIGATWSHYKSI